MRYCQVEFDCVQPGKKRQCGCVACDGHTDSQSDVCLVHVPVFDEDYSRAVHANESADVEFDS